MFKKQQKVILFVGRPNSIHTARWIGQVENHGWIVHLFSVNNAARHPLLKKVTVHATSANSINPWQKILRQCHLLRMDPVSRLAHTILKIRPDITHSLEMLQAGSLVSKAYDLIKGKKIPWIVSCWGNELFFYGRLKEHEANIKNILQKCDYFLCDCQRDADLAQGYGYKNEIMPVKPCGGGYEIAKARQRCLEPKASKRKLILLKGYQNEKGRALVGVRALELCAETIKSQQCRIAVYSVHNEDVRTGLQHLAKSTGIKVDIIPQAAHETMLELHGQSRISIGLSLSDGLSNSFLEAMLMGSFPVQSDTVGIPHWFRDGVNGILVPPEDPQKIAAIISKVLTDDTLVDQAARINPQIIAEHYERTAIQNEVIQMYDTIFNSKKGLSGKIKNG